MSLPTKMFAFFLFAMSSATAPARAQNCAAKETDIACTQQGAVRGVADGDMLAFKGIPYARPPVGALRWKPPELHG